MTVSKSDMMAILGVCRVFVQVQYQRWYHQINFHMFRITLLETVDLLFAVCLPLSITVFHADATPPADKCWYALHNCTYAAAKTVNSE
jgi:hypothetical protein